MFDIFKGCRFNVDSLRVVREQKPRLFADPAFFGQKPGRFCGEKTMEKLPLVFILIKHYKTSKTPKLWDTMIWENNNISLS